MYGPDPPDIVRNFNVISDETYFTKKRREGVINEQAAIRALLLS